MQWYASAIETNNSNDQSDLVKGRIANYSFVFTKWQHRTDGLAEI